MLAEGLPGLPIPKRLLAGKGRSHGAFQNQPNLPCPCRTARVGNCEAAGQEKRGRSLPSFSSLRVFPRERRSDWRRGCRLWRDVRRPVCGRTVAARQSRRLASTSAAAYQLPARVAGLRLSLLEQRRPGRRSSDRRPEGHRLLGAGTDCRFGFPVLSSGLLSLRHFQRSGRSAGPRSLPS